MDQAYRHILRLAVHRNNPRSHAPSKGGSPMPWHIVCTQRCECIVPHVIFLGESRNPDFHVKFFNFQTLVQIYSSLFGPQKMSVGYILLMGHLFAIWNCMIAKSLSAHSTTSIRQMFTHWSIIILWKYLFHCIITLL